MLTIRFARTGRKNRAQFQIVLQEHTVAPGGRHVEVLGSYDPHSKKTVLKEEKIKYWVSKGAQVSDSAFNLFLSKGVVTGEKRKVKMPKKVEAPLAEPIVAEEVKQEAVVEEAKPEVPVEEVPAVEEKAEEVKAE